MKRLPHIIATVSLALLSTAVGLEVYAQSRPALDPGRTLTQYIHQMWRDDSGLPQNTVRTIIQSQDGYFWLGTEEGLGRFDRVRFTVAQRLTESLEGSIFVESEKGKGSVFTVRFPAKASKASRMATRMVRRKRNTSGSITT